MRLDIEAMEGRSIASFLSVMEKPRDIRKYEIIDDIKSTITDCIKYFNLRGKNF